MSADAYEVHDEPQARAVGLELPDDQVFSSELAADVLDVVARKGIAQRGRIPDHAQLPPPLRFGEPRHDRIAQAGRDRTTVRQSRLVVERDHNDRRRACEDPTDGEPENADNQRRRNVSSDGTR